MEVKLTVDELMMFVEEGQLNDLEICDQIEQLTKGFQLFRLKMLLKHVEIHILVRRDALEFEYKQQIFERMSRLKEEGKPLPLIKFKGPREGMSPKAKAFAAEMQRTEVIDYQALLPMEAQLKIFALRKVEAFTRHFIRQQTGEGDTGAVTKAKGDSQSSRSGGAGVHCAELTSVLCSEEQGQYIPAVLLSSKIVDVLTECLASYFPGQEKELNLALQGRILPERITFHGSCRVLCELFRRVIYNGHTTNTKKDVAEWLSRNFNFIEKGVIKPVKSSNAYEYLTKTKGEISERKKRICNIDILQYERHKGRKDENG